MSIVIAYCLVGLVVAFSNLRHKRPKKADEGDIIICFGIASVWPLVLAGLLIAGILTALKTLYNKLYS